MLFDGHRGIMRAPAYILLCFALLCTCRDISGGFFHAQAAIVEQMSRVPVSASVTPKQQQPPEQRNPSIFSRQLAARAATGIVVSGMHVGYQIQTRSAAVGLRLSLAV